MEKLREKYNKLFVEVANETIQWMKTRVDYYSHIGDIKRYIFEAIIKTMRKAKDIHVPKEEICSHSNMDFNKWENLSEKRKCPDCEEMVYFFETCLF